MKFSAESGLWVGFLDYLRGLDSPYSGNKPEPYYFIIDWEKREDYFQLNIY